MIFETSMSIRKTICAIVALLLSAPAARAQYQQVDDIACTESSDPCARERCKLGVYYSTELNYPPVVKDIRIGATNLPIIFINTLGHEIEKDNRVSAWRTFG